MKTEEKRRLGNNTDGERWNSVGICWDIAVGNLKTINKTGNMGKRETAQSR